MSEPRRMEVKRCAHGPLHERILSGYGWRSRCDHPDKRGKRMTDDEAVAAPNWCPLRPKNGGPLLVALREEAIARDSRGSASRRT